MYTALYITTEITISKISNVNNRYECSVFNDALVNLEMLHKSLQGSVKKIKNISEGLHD